MKLFIATLLSFLLSIIALASAVDRPTASLPAASGGVVCAMSLCPTATLNKRDLTCPAHCKDNCRIIDDQCCPGVQKAVCNSSSAIESSTAAATPTAVSSSSSSSVSSIASSSSAASSSAQPTPSSATGNTNAPSSAVASTKMVLSSIVLMAMITLIVNAL
ncbi:hypothetical protein V8B55DRAFT_1546233 [Mucor lusitanicus]|uniref:WAP domain-containing protein n=2 Tax=Mucor circinelloides f. lusitanicus TaxID=29924 RepID=A0A162RK66_MUCCL|nr:hypothetical protein FB192DRAFT_1391029 [Mucor lusitanicus]OAD06709.1 hypothetical protein MUCCIDRAFT_155383 [Mucor lusitanicus CBS 277.49]